MNIMTAAIVAVAAIVLAKDSFILLRTMIYNPIITYMYSIYHTIYIVTIIKSNWIACTCEFVLSNCIRDGTVPSLLLLYM